MKPVLLRQENISHGDLLLVAPGHPLPPFPVLPEMTPALPDRPDILLQPHAAQSLQRLIATLDGWKQVTAVSGFRTQEEQEEIWRDTQAKEGLAFTQKYVALPGHSEHQTGLAIDLAAQSARIDFICPDFPHTGIFQKFRQLAPQFGFIERYLSGKESLTGIAAEPWHFRFVGVPHSIVIAQKHWVLEEYLSFLKNATAPGHPFSYRFNGIHFELFYVPMEKPIETTVEIPDSMSYSLSGTNAGGIVLTLWRSPHED